MQRIVFLFGPTVLKEVMDAPHLVVLPFMMYENLFDVYVYQAHQTIYIFETVQPIHTSNNPHLCVH